MKRLIEDLVERRKKKQQQLKHTLTDLAEILEKQGIFSRPKGKIKEKIDQLNTHLNELITIQDKEWDAYSSNHATTVFKSLQWKVEKLEAEYSNVKTLLLNFIELENNLKKLVKAARNKALPRGKISEAVEIIQELSAYQYSDFEQRFRGTFEQVKDKLKVYLPYFTDADNILDIGCGRGEFLEMIKDTGKNGLGIDISVSMLKTATERGIRCIKKDVLAFLKQSENNKFGGIFSAQVIEHLDPGILRDLILESYRVLKNNSPIILETINPLSLFALSNIYFLDITHTKPLHPEFMRYLLENSGFDEVEIFYTGDLESEKLITIPPNYDMAHTYNSNVDKLNKLLYASPTYAVKGIKRTR